MSSNTKFWIGVGLVSIPLLALFAAIIVFEGWLGVLIVLGSIVVTSIIMYGGYLIETN